MSDTPTASPLATPAPHLDDAQRAALLASLQFIAPRSGNVHGVAFQDGALFVKFQGGKVYRYTLAPTAPEVQRGIIRAHYDGMLAAPSCGSYFAANVKGNKLIECELIGVHVEHKHEHGDGV